MRKKPTLSPGREARDVSFIWRRISAMWKRLTCPRFLETRKEIGSAKSCACSLSRSKAVATFCLLYCGAPSSLPLRSKHHTILNASTMLRAMDRNKNVSSHSEMRTNGSKIIPTSFLNLLTVSVECVRTGRYSKSRPRRWWNEYQASPKPQMETTHKKLVGMALYGPAVVHCKAWASALRVALSAAHMNPN